MLHLLSHEEACHISAMKGRSSASITCSLPELWEETELKFYYEQHAPYHVIYVIPYVLLINFHFHVQVQNTPEGTNP